MHAPVPIHIACALDITLMSTHGNNTLKVLASATLTPTETWHLDLSQA